MRKAGVTEILESLGALYFLNRHLAQVLTIVIETAQEKRPVCRVHKSRKTQAQVLVML